MARNLTSIGAAVLLAVGAVTAEQVCHLAIDGCPEALNGMTINVPLEAVAMAGEANFCPPDISMQGMAHVEASIMLIIDDSGSMYTLPGGAAGSGNDPNGERYKVTAELLDQIYAVSPKTRVGVVAFRNWLAWDWRDDSMFRKIGGFQWNDSYFPLVPLDSTLANGKTGLQTIKDLFTLDQWNMLQAYHTNDSTERTRPTCSGGLQCTKNQQGTDITLAFTAARDAMSYSPTPRERQFFIFLSDGLPGAVDVEMEAQKFAFIDGDSTPTTFTIFLGASIQTPPDQLLEMTQNIRTNRYSSANARSELWSVATSHDTLLSLMQRAVLTEVFRPIVTPIDASIGVGGSTNTSVSATDSSFVFQAPIPLQPQTTAVTMQLGFTYDDSNGVAIDTTLGSQFSFVRNAQASWSSLPAGVTKICYERATVLSSGGKLITGVITNSQTQITVSLTLEGVSATSTQTAVIATPSGSDQVTVPLTYSNGVWSGTFSREAATAISGDNTLQHGLLDTAVVSWQNADVPLDVMQKSYPISSYDPVAVTSVSYLDNNADGFIDAIRVETGSKFNPAEIDSLTASRFGFPDYRKLAYAGISVHSDTSGFDILVTQDESVGKNTAVDPAKDSLIINKYVIGPYNYYIPQGTYAILDDMAPVLVSVTYKPAQPGSSSPTTLTAVFSEDVPQINYPQPFQFVGSDGTTYTMSLSPVSAQGETHEFTVSGINPANMTPQPGDSVYINPSANIMDTDGNRQDKRGEAVPLQIEYPPYEFQVYAGPNPFRVGQQQSTLSSVPGAGSGYGTVIVVQSNLPTDQTSSNIKKISVDVYDCVANLVAKNLTSVKVGDNFHIQWDGRNRNNRFVSGGTYLAVVSVTSTDSKGKSTTKKQRVKIGVMM